MTALSVALGAAALLGLVAGLLAIPVEVRFRGAVDPTPRLRLQLVWLFGSLRRELHAGGTRKGSAEAPSLRTLYAIWNDELQHRVVALLRALGDRILVREIRVRGRFGLGDPADTARAWAVIAPLAQAAASLPHVTVWLEPDFLEAGFHGEAAGLVRVVPLALLRPLVTFGCSRPTLRALRALRAAARGRPRRSPERAAVPLGS